MDDILINKSSSIERCLFRIAEEYQSDEDELRRNHTKQDSVILNLQRACEASIDMANRQLRLLKAPIPQSSRDSFSQLYKLQIISEDIATSMEKMVGLRNIAVHDYQNLNIEIVIAVLNHHLQDFRFFIQQVLSHADNRSQ